MKLTISNEKMTQFAWVMMASFAMMLLPADAFAEEAAAAATPAGLQSVMCNVVGWLTGPVGSAIATLAIIVIGLGALMGKVSWGMAIIVGLGVGIVFGAPQIVSALATGTGGRFVEC